MTEESPDKDEIRAEFAGLVASLRAYVEWQRDAGTIGFPRVRRAAQVASASTGLPEQSMPDEVLAQVQEEPPPAAAPQSQSQPPPPPPPVPAHVPESKKPPVEPRVRLMQLAEEAQACRRCSLGSTRTQAVLSRGSITPKVMFVGEAPGVDDDKQGSPFVGRAGQLLDRMIAAMGLAADKDVYICNVLKCRPAERPQADQIAACMPYLHEQIALVSPQVIVALGNTAAMALLDTKLGIDKVRGQWRLYRGQRMLMSTYHPSFLLRPGPEQAPARKTAWEDLQLVMKELGLKSPKGPVDV